MYRRPPLGMGTSWEVLALVVGALMLGGLLAAGILWAVGIIHPAVAPIITGP